MASGFRFDSRRLVDGLSDFGDRFQMALETFADNGSKKLEGYARENARWQNRTGHARQRLTGDYLRVNRGIKLRLSHGVDYGKWLELANEKKYSIIPETIEKVGDQEIMPAFENFLERLNE